MKPRLYSLIALVTGAGIFSIISIVINPGAPAKSWFVYQKGDPLDPRNFTRAVGNPSCHGAGTLCAVYAEVSPGNIYQPAYRSLEELAAQSANFRTVVPGLVEHRNSGDLPFPGVTGRLP